jgi:hypothetical protein
LPTRPVLLKAAPAAARARAMAMAPSRPRHCRSHQEDVRPLLQPPPTPRQSLTPRPPLTPPRPSLTPRPQPPPGPPPGPPPPPPPPQPSQATINTHSGNAFFIGWCPKCHQDREDCFRPGDWACAHCGQHNDDSMDTCSSDRCGRPREDLDLSSASDAPAAVVAGRWCPSCRMWKKKCYKSNDWECPWCGNHCFARKQVGRNMSWGWAGLPVACCCMLNLPTLMLCASHAPFECAREAGWLNQHQCQQK